MKKQQTYKGERIKNITYNMAKNKDLIYWDDAKKKLIGTTDNKIKKYFELNLIRHIKEDIYLVLPIPDYNITTYRIKGSICTCQGFATYGKCTHIKAVDLFKNIAKNKQ